MTTARHRILLDDLGTGMERGAGISYDRMEDLLASLQR
jgi:hypothetical protein